MNNFKSFKYGDHIIVEAFGATTFDPPLNSIFISKNKDGDIGLVAFSWEEFNMYHEEKFIAKPLQEIIKWGRAKLKNSLEVFEFDMEEVNSKYGHMAFMFVAEPTVKKGRSKYSRQELVNQLENEINKTTN